ncbi:hypothetical protein OG512_08775 [Streptomyces sp. NBC_01378]
MADRVQVRHIDDDEGQRLLRIIRRGTGSVVTWRRAQMVLLSAQGMPVAQIVEVSFASADRVRSSTGRTLPDAAVAAEGVVHRAAATRAIR